MGLFNRKRRLPKVGETVLFVTEEGCQAINIFRWVGKVVGKEKDTLFVKVIKYAKSYGDFRDYKEDVIKELYCPEGSANMTIKKLDSIWVYTE